MRHEIFTIFISQVNFIIIKSICCNVYIGNISILLVERYFRIDAFIFKDNWILLPVFFEKAPVVYKIYTTGALIKK